MRIAIDLQGAQAENRQRGIGKYSLHLALGLSRLRNAHEIFVVLNGAFPDSIGPIRAEFEGLLPQDHILVWSAPMPVAFADPANSSRRREAELLREAFLAALELDWVLVPSHFEGQGNNAVTSIGAWRRLPTAVLLHDLIPWIHADHYLARATTRDWYYEKFDGLKRADLLLSNSFSTRSEAIEHLELAPESVVNISAAVETHFKPQPPSDLDLRRLADVYGLTREFVMYTGGIDYRKNLDGLIKSFASLPTALRARHQLAIVCYMNDDWKEKLNRLIKNVGLEKDNVVLTGYVSDEDLHLLYNACKLFVFPSWHEGFGLPLLEAMQCGKPVLAAGRTSIPEIVGREDALFDPFDLADMAKKIERGLSDEAFRNSLSEYSLLRSRNFSWDLTAERAWRALELALETRPSTLSPQRRLRLALVSPLPPDRSGIADYSASLLREITRWYRTDVVVTDPDQLSDAYVRATCGVLSVEEFRAAADQYDRVLYHFGNSTLHAHMFNLLSEIPGVVVLHDFYLSAIQMWSEVHDLRFASMARALLAERGYQAVAERFGLTDKKFDFDEYPACLPVIQDALGVIVHSEFSRGLARKWYGDEASEKLTVVPFLHRDTGPADDARAAAREKLDLAPEAFVVCSFGFVTEAKLIMRLIDAWMASSLSRRLDAHCVLVGEAPGDFGRLVRQTLANSPQAARIKLTDWVGEGEYRLWLNAADAAVQLRKNSRGETSASIYDCMGKGLPTIVNAHGFAAELDPRAVWLLPDEFTDRELADSLETLARDVGRRKAIGDYARNLIRTTHNLRLCAELYFNSIERSYARAERDSLGVAKAVYKESGALSQNFLTALAENSPLRPRRRQLLIDVSELMLGKIDRATGQVEREALRKILLDPPADLNVEPVYADEGTQYKYARQFTLQLLKCPEGVASDEPVQARSGDVYLSLDCSASALSSRASFYHRLRAVGAPVLFCLDDNRSTRSIEVVTGGRDDARNFLSRSGLPLAIADALVVGFENYLSARRRTAGLAWLPLVATLESAHVPVDRPPADAIILGPKVEARPRADNPAIHNPIGGNGSPAQPIEQNLFHIIIQDGMQLPASLPDAVAQNIESLRSVYPHFSHALHCGESLRAFIDKHYDREVLKAFDTLRPYAYKADLGRYCLLHTLGGVYSDLGNRFVRPVSLSERHTLAAFADTNGGLGSPWSVNNGVIAARKQSPELELLIKKVLQNVKGHFYGRSPLSPTGPDLFGRVLAECYNPNHYLIGDMACVTRTFSQNITFVFLEPSGTLVAIRMKAQGGDSRELGMNLKNNYNDLWDKRAVYGE